MTSLYDIKEPLVSIIIPVFNEKQYLKEALDSAINQTYGNLEIIVVDDGSTDGSEKVCDEYAQKDARIKVIHRENGGLSAARNTGLDNINGEYVAFLDSDDIFLPEAIEKSLNAMLSHEADCVVFKFIISQTVKIKKNKKLPNNKIIPSVNKGIYSKKEALKEIAERNINVASWNKLFKRKIWDNLRFPEGHVYEDLYIIFKMIDRAEKIIVIDDVLLVYRNHPGSITATASVKNIRDWIDSWSVFENYIEMNTPELFDSEQIQMTRKKILIYMVLQYAEKLSKHFSEKSEVLNLMKEKIISLEKVVNISECSSEIRLVYYFMFNYPKLMSICYMPIYKIYRIIKRIFRTIAK